MQYFITFLEGIISFVSPCMLPMLPIYVSYFAGNSGDKKPVLKRSICFVLGFTLVFSAMGLFAGTLGAFFTKYQTAVNIVTGAIVIVFGLGYLEIINLPFFKGMSTVKKPESAFSAFIFGIIYSVSLTPCVGAFLGSALMLASSSETALEGFILLLLYSAGLGVPFVVSAVLLNELSAAFDFIKKHYGIINKICGIFLIVVGVSMMFGFLGKLLSLFS